MITYKEISKIAANKGKYRYFQLKSVIKKSNLSIRNMQFSFGIMISMIELEWAVIRMYQIPTFGKDQAKTTDGKVINVKADCELFDRLLIAAKGRDVNLKDVLKFELSHVP